MNNTFKILFHLRKPKLCKEGPQPIYMRLAIDGQRAEIATQRDSNPRLWNSTSGRINGTRESIKMENAHMDSLVSKVYNCQNDLIRKGARVTANAIKNKLSGKGEKGRMLVPIFKQHNKEVENLIGNGYAQGTLDRYKVTLNHVVEFMQKKYG